MDLKQFQFVHGMDMKIIRGEALSIEEQAYLVGHGTSIKFCGCGCGKPLEPRIDGERHQIDGKEVNSDCFFASLPDETGILAGRPRPHGGCGTID